LEGVRERAGTGTENVESKLPAEDLLAGGDDGLLDDDELLGEDDSNGSNGDVGDGEPVIPVVPIKTTVSIQNPIQPIQTSPVLKKKMKLDREPIKAGQELPTVPANDLAPASKIKTEISEQDRLKLRQIKFGGNPANTTTTTSDVLKKRNERFGGGSGKTTTQLDPEKLAKRKERFGEIASGPTGNVDEKKKLRGP